VSLKKLNYAELQIHLAGDLVQLSSTQTYSPFVNSGMYITRQYSSCVRLSPYGKGGLTDGDTLLSLPRSCGRHKSEQINISKDRS
jgi:hypothetical protein